MADKKQFPYASMKFMLEAGENAVDFYRRMSGKQEQAVPCRIDQLFGEFVEVGGDNDHIDEATQKLRRLFGIAYRLGWNDHFAMQNETR